MSDMITCKKCNTQLAAGTKFCSQCGTPVEQPKLTECPKCKTALKGNELFCPSCGNKLQTDTKVTTGPTATDTATITGTTTSGGLGSILGSQTSLKEGIKNGMSKEQEAKKLAQKIIQDVEEARQKREQEEIDKMPLEKISEELQADVDLYRKPIDPGDSFANGTELKSDIQRYYKKMHISEEEKNKLVGMKTDEVIEWLKQKGWII